MEDFENNEKEQKENFFQVEKEEVSKPHPLADHTYFVFDDLEKGQVRQGHFILRNVGGDYKDFEIVSVQSGPSEAVAESFLKIIDAAPLSADQTDKMPLKVSFEVKAMEWSRFYSASIILRLDDQEETISVNLNTQTKPVNDFAGIFKPQEIKKITGLVRKLEKTTGAEISVVSVDSFDGKSVEEYSNELFNLWGIGKEDRHNGLLFLISKNQSKYRIEVGLGLEKLITADFINSLFEKYVIPNFSAGKFGTGVYKTLAWIASKITLDHRKKDRHR
jgi:hypothetical protein